MKTIYGVEINVNHPDVKGKSEEELRKLEFFAHLSKEEQDAAYAELATLV